MNARVNVQMPGRDRLVVIGEASNGTGDESIKLAYHYSNGSLSRAAEMTADELVYLLRVALDFGFVSRVDVLETVVETMRAKGAA